jgi:hypothetical protein
MAVFFYANTTNTTSSRANPTLARTPVEILQINLGSEAV